jgi:6-pyruvoyltetrahydropterin/6-carboxytetrahydropterin synthase
MGSVSMTRRYRFCAAHRLHTECLSPEENRAAFGKCNNPNGHGHNYVVFVTVAAGLESVPSTEVTKLDELVRDAIVKRFDHRDLNQDPLFADRTTTGENLVVLIWNLLEKRLPEGQLTRVGVIETRDNYFEYSRPTQRQARMNEVGRG